MTNIAQYWYRVEANEIIISERSQQYGNPLFFMSVPGSLSQGDNFLYGDATKCIETHRGL